MAEITEIHNQILIIWHLINPDQPDPIIDLKYSRNGLSIRHRAVMYTKDATCIRAVSAAFGSSYSEALEELMRSEAQKLVNKGMRNVLDKDHEKEFAREFEKEFDKGQQRDRKTARRSSLSKLGCF